VNPLESQSVHLSGGTSSACLAPKHDPNRLENRSDRYPVRKPHGQFKSKVCNIEQNSEFSICYVVVVPESHSPSWKVPFFEALLETDKARLTALVHATEGAMLLRWQELTGSDDHHAERTELKQACEGLLSIQINKLGWPSSISMKSKSSD
jgi:hypothetical protein